MNIFAGFLLKGRNPRHAPTSEAITSATSPSDTKSAMTSIEMALMVETPQARPSSPSMRLTAFVMPTIHKTVMGTASQPRSQYGLSAKTLGFESVWMTTPWNTATSAAKICTQNLKYARSGDISSTTPKTTIMDAPNKMPFSW